MPVVVVVGFKRKGRSVGATLLNGEVRIWNAPGDQGRTP
jgi:hypothetical protein